MIAAFDDPLTPLWEATYGDGIDQLVEYRDFAARGPVVPLADNRNSPVATWNPARQSVEGIARWDVHGRLTLLDANEFEVCAEPGNAGTICDSPSGMPFAFNGRWRSPVTGLVNMRARWYSPRLGQFTAPDPLGYVDTYNLYGFAAFDPVNGWDPYGLDSCSFWGGCIKSQLEEEFDLPPDDPQRERARQKAGEEMVEGARKSVTNAAKTVGCTMVSGALPGGVLTHGLVCGASVFEHEEIEGPYEQVGDNLVFTVSIAGGPEFLVVGAARLLVLLRSGRFVKWLKSGRGAVVVRLRAKPVNLPAWKKLEIDWEEVISGHTRGGWRVMPNSRKDLFPDYMGQPEIERAMRDAYSNAKRLKTQGDRVKIRGQSRDLTIEMWLNTATKTIETAYPVF